MKLKFFLLFLFISVINSYGQTAYDTLKAEKVGPGMTHYQLRNYSIPWSVNIFEVDLTNQYVDIETIKGGDKVTGLETTSSMASRNSREGHKVIAATNADFWGASVPIGKQVSNGEIVKMYQDHAYPLSSLIFNENNKPYLNNVSFSGSVTVKDTSADLYGVNRTRETDKFVLYNKYMGASTGTNEYGTEVVLTPVNGWTINDTVKLVVNEIISRVGNAAIPAGKVVLSGHGLSELFINKKMQINDTVKIVFSINTGTKERINQLIGGYPRIVKDGVNYAIQGMAEEGGPDHGVNREPRTAIGFSQDSTKLYLFTVDGRQSSLSSGMTLSELADVMIQSGVYQGMNFDGGGSTTMVIRDAIANSPSDATGERTVSNSIQVISSAPDGNLSILQMSPKSSRLFFGEKIQYSVKGWDEYFNPYSISTFTSAVSFRFP
ncbi:MAG TPA: phosphodiester glycosidase family protein [Ignavibacteriales bacterium]|nr:phosphodiester glycosidase family protein [Ignavibacteriales bacterium]